MRVLLVTALLVSTLAAGCLSASGKSLTAHEGLADAQAAARSWADGKQVQLVGIAAVEPFKHLNHTSPDGHSHVEVVTHLDAVPGDGNAPGWIYAFVAGDRCIGIVLAAGLGVLAEGYATCDPKDSDVLPAWPVDSDQVAKILGSQPQWPKPAEGSSYLWALSARNGQALWTVVAQVADGPSVLAVVNAANGTVVAVRPMPSSSADVSLAGGDASTGSSVEHGSQSQSDSSPLVRAGAPIEAKIHLEAAGRLHLQVTYLAGLGVQVKLHGPDGDVESAAVPSGGLDKTYDVPAGDYSLTVTTDLAGAGAMVQESMKASW